MPPNTVPELPYVVVTTDVPAICSASVSWPIRTVTLPASCWAASSRSTTTCSSSASSTDRSDPPKSAVLRVRLAVPPISNRSSECSTSDSSSTVAERPTASLNPPEPSSCAARSDTATEAAASRLPSSACPSSSRSWAS